MKPEQITLNDLFEKQRRYLVPLFQRGYVWTESQQWEPLWMDVLDQVQAARYQAATTQRARVRKHFMGAVVLSQVQTGIRQLPAVDVIDGQQRLMTLQILLAALRDVCATDGSEYLTSGLGRMTKNPGPFRDADEEFKVWPTAAYRDDIRNVMTTGSAEALTAKYPLRRPKYARRYSPRPRPVEAYLFFHDKIRRYLHTPEDLSESAGSTAAPAQPGEQLSEQPSDHLDVSRAEELFDTLKDQLQLVAIQLDADDDPQVIFETLNYRGVPLEPSDLVRNFVFLYATRNEGTVDELYDRYWARFDAVHDGKQGFWKETVRQGRFRKDRLDLFLFHYLTAQTERDIKIGHIFQEFREWWESPAAPRVTAPTLEHLCASSDVFKALSVPERGTPFGVFGKRLGVLDTTTVYPLVLWLAERPGGLSEDEFLGMLVDIESYLVRRAVCSLTPKNYNRTFLSLLSKLKLNARPCRSALQQELLAFRGESNVWPDDESFQDALVRKPLYHQLGPAKTRMLLEGIDAASQTSKQETLHLEDTWMSVEHVLPQSWVGLEHSWPFPDDGADLGMHYLQRTTLVHSLGNLTLLTQPLNSSLLNAPFALKRPQITKQSRLVLNAYFQQFADTDAWDETTILTRGTELATVALRVWPRPPRHSGIASAHTPRP